MKKKRIKVENLADLQKELLECGYSTNLSLTENLTNIFNIDKKQSIIIEKTFLNENISYTSENITSLIDYLYKIYIFKKEHLLLCSLFKNINTLKIQRIEYHRDPSPQENIEHIISSINNLECTTFTSLTCDEIKKFDEIEKNLNDNYLFSKDIELLKSILFENNNGNFEYHDPTSMIKETSFVIPDTISTCYIKAPIGGIEHYNHITACIPRLKRIIKNLNKYLIKDTTFHILNQSKTLLDSINIAYCKYDNTEFKALSGDVVIHGYCTNPKVSRFDSTNVNRLGMVGTGYTRENDSEKKILEVIHNRIKNKLLSKTGDLTLYTKWEPCQSCYYVISQFSKEYPNINITIKYSKKYGI